LDAFWFGQVRELLLIYDEHYLAVMKKGVNINLPVRYAGDTSQPFFHNSRIPGRR